MVYDPAEVPEPVGGEWSLTATVRDATRTGLKAVGLRMAIQVVGFGASILIARALGPRGRGLYALPVVIVGLAVTLSHGGLEHAQIYLASRRVPLRRLWGNASAAALGAGVVSWVVVGVLYVVSGGALLGGLPVSWIAVSMGLVPFLLAVLYWTNLLQLDGKLLLAMRAALLGVGAHAVAVAVMYVTGTLTPFRVLVLLWIANGATWVLLAQAGRRHGLASAAVDVATLRRAFAFGMKVYGGLLFLYLLLRVDQIIVEAMLGYRALGLYSLAAMLAELLWLVSDPLAMALTPHQIRAAAGDDRRLGFTVARLNVTLAAVAGLAAWLLAPTLIPLVYGTEFAGSVWPFRLLVPGAVALAVLRPLHAVVLREGRAWLLSGLGAGALAANVVGTVLLLPMVGVAGASITSTLCYAGVAAAYVASTREKGVAGPRDLVPRLSDLRLVLRPRESSEVRRVLLAVNDLDRGGTEHQVVVLAEGLVARGIDVTVVSLFGTGPLVPRLRSAGVGVVEGSMRPARGRFPAPFGLVSSLALVWRTIRAERPDVVQTFLYLANIVVIPLAAAARVPVIIGSRRNLTRDRGAVRGLGSLERLADRLADVIVCNAEAVRTDAALPDDRTMVVPNGVRIPPAVPPPPGLVEGLVAANLLPYKGHDVLLEAVASVPDVRLALVGSGPLEASLRKQAASLGVDGRVRFLGQVEDVGPLYEACAFVVLPSRTEGMPNAVLEAMAYGRPVVATSVGGTPEALEHGGGLLVPAGDASALAGAIARLASDPALRDRMGAEGRRAVEEHFSVDRLVERMIALYEEHLDTVRV